MPKVATAASQIIKGGASGGTSITPGGKVGSSQVDGQTVGLNASNQLEVKDASIGAAKLAAAVAGAGLAGGGGTALSVNVDGVGIEIATDTLQLKDGGVAAAKLASGQKAADHFSLGSADVSGSKVGNTAYQNTGTTVMLVFIWHTGGSSTTFQVQIGDTNALGTGMSTAVAGTNEAYCALVVKPNGWYGIKRTAGAGSATIKAWTEAQL